MKEYTFSMYLIAGFLYTIYIEGKLGFVFSRIERRIR